MENVMASSLIQKKERDSWFDNVKGILILLVVVAHFSELIIAYTDKEPYWLDVMFRFIYVFHMPVFMIISGRFAKNRIDKNDWITVINKLIVPYVIVQTVMMVFYAFFDYSSVSGFSYFKPLFGLWYIITVAVYQLITPHFKKLKGAFFVALLVAVVVQLGRAAPFGGFMRLFTYYPCFLFGYKTAELELSFCKKIWFKICSFISFVVFFAIVWIKSEYFGAWALTMRRVYSSLAENFMKIGIDFSRLDLVLYTLMHYLMGFAFFFIIVSLVPAKKQVFGSIGKYSLYTYVLHLFIVVALAALDTRYGILDFINTDIKVVVFLVFSVVVAFFFSTHPVRRVMGWLVEPKFDLRKLAKQLIEER